MTANDSNKTKIESKITKQVFLIRFFEGIFYKIILIGISNKINLFR